MLDGELMAALAKVGEVPYLLAFMWMLRNRPVAGGWIRRIRPPCVE
jgi:hypothetical protein